MIQAKTKHGVEIKVASYVKLYARCNLSATLVKALKLKLHLAD